MASNRHSIHGSERQPVPGSRRLGPADPGERLEVTVMVRAGNPDKLQEHLRKRMSRPMTRDEYEKAHGASSADFDKVSKFASEHGLSTVERSAARRSMVLSGTVENAGAGVNAFSDGDALYAMLGGIDRGSYAEYVLVRPHEAAPKPARLSHIEAAAVPLAALTAWQGLFDHGHLEDGQTVLIHGGSGGVGHFAIQFAKVKGATV